LYSRANELRGVARRRILGARDARAQVCITAAAPRSRAASTSTRSEASSSARHACARADERLGLAQRATTWRRRRPSLLRPHRATVAPLTAAPALARRTALVLRRGAPPPVRGSARQTCFCVVCVSCRNSKNGAAWRPRECGLLASFRFLFFWILETLVDVG